jgi:Dolichyl-phosphate-mannose-protein mannosyltransferase
VGQCSSPPACQSPARLDRVVTRFVRGDRRRAWALGLLIGTIVAGVALRAAVQLSSLGVPDGDEAVWGLMVRHALHGQLTAFFWGQGYGGTQEVLLTTPLYAAFGTSMFLARLVPMALVAVACVIVWRVGRRTVGEPAATVAGALMWVWPPYLIWKSDRAHGFYGSGLVLGALVLLLVLRLTERRSRRDSALLGLVLGLAWWQTPQIVPVALPALVFLAWRCRRETLGVALAAVPLAVLGALPWLLSNLHHHWWSFHIDAGATPYPRRLRGFFSATLPMAVGLRVPFTSQWLLGTVVSGIVYVGLLGLFVSVAWRRRSRAVALLAAVAAAYPFLYAISPATWLVDEPRYVVMLMPALVLLLVQGIRRFATGAFVVAGGIALSAFVLARLATSPAYDQRADGLDIPASFTPLVHELDRRSLDHVFADYWVAYRLDFQTHERVVAAEALLPTLARHGDRVLPRVPVRANDNHHPAYDREVRASAHAGFVLVAWTTEDERARPLLEQTGYRRTTVGGFAVYGKPPS